MLVKNIKWDYICFVKELIVSDMFSNESYIDNDFQLKLVRMKIISIYRIENYLIYNIEDFRAKYHNWNSFTFSSNQSKNIEGK